MIIATDHSHNTHVKYIPTQQTLQATVLIMHLKFMQLRVHKQQLI